MEVVEHKYLLEIEDNTLGFLNQTLRQRIDHLKVRGGALDFTDTKTLLTDRDMEWDISENPQIYFNRVEKAVKALTRANITSDMNQLQDMALYHFKASGEFDAAVREWENKPATDKTWVNIKTFISVEYARKKKKQKKLTAKQFKANAMEEQAEAMEESIATLTENHTHQMEALTKSTTEAMKEMMQLVKLKPLLQRKPPKRWTKRRRKNMMRNKRSTTKHWSAHTVAKSIHQRKRTNAGNSRKTNHLARRIGNRLKAPEGVRGPQ